VSAQDILNIAVLDQWGCPTPRIRLFAYASVGGYPIIYLTRSNSVLCADCAQKEIRAWLYDESNDPPTDRGIHWEGPPEVCEDCNREIESAYGDPEENDS
jgi:hypothetical protein